uniref:Putative secreted protein n=1 Tax=Anopheles marajoara TaxID=58244 RepID=A0A2M4C7A0_9DIPT
MCPLLLSFLLLPLLLPLLKVICKRKNLLSISLSFSRYFFHSCFVLHLRNVNNNRQTGFLNQLCVYAHKITRSSPYVQLYVFVIFHASTFFTAHQRALADIIAISHIKHTRAYMHIWKCTK